MNAPRIVACPTCGKNVRWEAESRYRPFCSERCRQIDLGAWANEEYRVASAAPLDDFNPDAPAGATTPRE